MANIVTELTETPVSDQLRAERVTVKLTATQKEAFEENARDAGKNLSDWIRDTLMEVPPFDPRHKDIRQAFLEQALSDNLSEQAAQFKHFVEITEKLFGPMTTQLSNHREWMKGTLENFSAEFATQTETTVAKLDKRLDESKAIQLAAKAQMKATEEFFYQRGIWILVAVFVVALFGGLLLGHWRP